MVPEKEGPATRRPSTDQGASLGLRASVSTAVRTQQQRRLYHQPREPFSEKGRRQYSSVANLKTKEARTRGFGPLPQLAQVTSTEERSPDRGRSHRAIGPAGRPPRAEDSGGEGRAAGGTRGRSEGLLMQDGRAPRPARDATVLDRQTDRQRVCPGTDTGPAESLADSK